MKSREVMIAGAFLLLSAIVITVIGLWPEPAPVEETPVIFSTDTPEIVMQYFDRILNQGDLGAIEEIFAAQHLLYIRSDPLEGTGHMLRLVEGMRTALPDVRFQVDQVIVEGESIAVRYTFHGTHDGEGFGVPPTGTSVSATGILISRVEGGKIVETWDIIDWRGVANQLGRVSSRMRSFAHEWGRQLEDPAVEPGDPEHNKALVLECVEQVWNQGNLELAEALHAPGFRPHETTYLPAMDILSYMKLVRTMRDEYPDLVVTVEEMVAEDYDVAARWTARGGGMGWWGITIYRIVDGRISETWGSRDSLDLFQEAGVISFPPP